jgi:hypothetical protein
MAAGGLKLLYNLLLKDAVKGSGEASGIMSIGDSVRKLAEKKFQSYVMSAQKQGVDLDKMGESELKYMLELNKPKNKMKVVSQGDPEFKEIMDAMMGKKKDNVIKGKFGKPFKEEADEILNTRQMAMDDKVAADMYQGGPTSGDPKTDADMLAEFIAEDAGKVYDDLPTKERLGFYDRAYNAIMRYRRDRSDFTDGGRIGFKKGMDRRTFMKIMGGLTALPVLGKFFKGAEVAAPVIEKAKDVASGAPPYFFNLVDKIRTLGKRFAGPKERSEFFRYKDYEMDVDYDTGVIEIKKTKEAMIPGGDEAGVSEEVYMTYKPGRGDEATRGAPADEYEEFTAKPDIDGKMKDVEEGVPDEVIEEGTVFEDNITEFGKASGGIARMLGE